MDYIYASELGPRVTEVCPLKNYTLLLTFDNGEKRLFCAKALLKYKAFAPLKNTAFFNSVSVKLGTVVWPMDIDYCPDTLYSQSIPCPQDFLKTEAIV